MTRLTTTFILAMLASMSYPGGKNGSGVYQRIINLMPPHEVYIEPFLGGGAVMRLKRPAALNIGVDLDRGALELPMPPGSPELAISDERDTGTLVTSDDASSFRLLESDGIEFLRAYPFTGSELVYADPPYLMSARTGRSLYRFEMSDLQHRDLLRVLRKLPCRVMVSGYSSVLYARELAGWNATSFPSMTRGGTERAEWLWYNFPPPVALHDYRYLGRDFRERESIKRQKARWVARLDRMPTLKRQALLAAIAESAGFSDGARRGSTRQNGRCSSIGTSDAGGLA